MINFLLFGIVARLPGSVHSVLGSIAGNLIYLFAGREKKIADLQLKIFLGQSDPQPIIKQMFVHLAQQFFVSLNTARVLPHQVKWISKSGVTLDEISTLEHGALGLTGHIGNWDLLGAYFARVSAPICTIGKTARLATLQKVLETIRSRNGVQTIWREDKKAPKQILSAIRGKNILAALIDQDTVVPSVHIPFFGSPAKTPSGLASLAQKCNTPIYTAFMTVDSATQYSLHIERVSPDLSEESVLLFFHQQLEAVIRHVPWQWTWFHKRWRSPDESTTYGTKAYLAFLQQKLNQKNIF